MLTEQTAIDKKEGAAEEGARTGQTALDEETNRAGWKCYGIRNATAGRSPSTSAVEEEHRGYCRK
eukprot:6463387-Amphidinium_carterae.1